MKAFVDFLKSIPVHSALERKGYANGRGADKRTEENEEERAKKENIRKS